MKSKKKIGLVKRIAAGVCAVMLVVSSMGVCSFYYGATDYLALFFDNREMAVDSEFTIYDIPLTDKMLEYKYLALFCSGDYQYYYAICSNEPFELVFDVDRLAFYGSAYDTEGSVPVISYYRTADSEWKTSNFSTWNLLEITEVNDEPIVKNGRCNYIFSNFPLYCGDYLFFDNGSVGSDGAGSYNSSLGYLQDIKRQFIYLEDDAFDLVEDTAACKFTFANTTTSGLDITDGNWSIRHYMQIEVKNAKKEYETVEVYDKVYLNEYPAADGKIIYQQKDTVQRLHEESGFDGLSWWQSNFLGYITYYNDYFQLVRTNEDGSVEYGGYVKVWQDEYNINHSTTLGEDESQDNSGYNDNIVSGSHGSGGTYEEAEKDADENAANSSTSSGEAVNELNDMMSSVSAVPDAFARMFSFLPDWCLGSIAVTLVFCLALVVWKTAR